MGIDQSKERERCLALFGEEIKKEEKALRNVITDTQKALTNTRQSLMERDRELQAMKQEMIKIQQIANNATMGVSVRQLQRGR